MLQPPTGPMPRISWAYKQNALNHPARLRMFLIVAFVAAPLLSIYSELIVGGVFTTGGIVGWFYTCLSMLLVCVVLVIILAIVLAWRGVGSRLYVYYMDDEAVFIMRLADTMTLYDAQAYALALTGALKGDPVRLEMPKIGAVRETIKVRYQDMTSVCLHRALGRIEIHAARRRRLIYAPRKAIGERFNQLLARSTLIAHAIHVSDDRRSYQPPQNVCIQGSSTRGPGGDTERHA